MTLDLGYNKTEANSPVTILTKLTMLTRRVVERPSISFVESVSANITSKGAVFIFDRDEGNLRNVVPAHQDIQC